MQRNIFFIVLFLFFTCPSIQAILIPAYYINSKGDTTHGKIQVVFSDEKDSISYYEIQYSALFANGEGKVLCAVFR